VSSLALDVAPWAPIDYAGEFEYRVDYARAERVRTFFEKVLVHPRDKTPFILTDWQWNDIILPIFGTMHFDDHYNEWVRQYNLAWIEMARKNGKSEFLAGVALYLLCADGQHMAEVYGAACDRDQAALVYNTAKAMVEASPYLSSRLKVIDSQKRIIYPATNSVYKVIPADAGGALGTNPSGIVFDEVLTQPNRELWDALKTGLGARKNALMVAATTAAYTTAKFALEEHDYGARLLRKPTIDPQRFVFMRNLSKEWDWRDEGTPEIRDESGRIVRQATGWYYSNPGLGDFLNINTLRAEAREAAEKPQAQNAFRVFRLNQWTSQANRWLDMNVYKENGEPTFDEYDERLKGRKAYYGLDIGSNRDFTAYVILIPGSLDDPNAEGFVVLPRVYIPREALTKRSKMREELNLWVDAGFVKVTDGQTTDYDSIERDLMLDAQTFPIIHIGYDPFQAGQLVQHLDEMGLSVVKIPQTMQRLTTPTKMLEDHVVKRIARHGGHPVLEWMADNVELDMSADGEYMKPSKKNSGEKIDGIAAWVNALYCSLIPEEEEEEQHEVTFIPF
jgi:phage terminase large subunit-like protein